jgi:hypothetical protein
VADERVTVPKGPREPKDHLLKSEVVDLARILKALQTIETNSQDRAKDLKLFLFFLPLIWGIVWGTLYFVIMLAASRS